MQLSSSEKPPRSAGQLRHAAADSRRSTGQEKVQFAQPVQIADAPGQRPCCFARRAEASYD